MLTHIVLLISQLSDSAHKCSCISKKDLYTSPLTLLKMVQAHNKNSENGLHPA